MGIKRDALDALFSDYVRLRDRYVCQRCGRYHEPPTSAIHCAHIFSRRHKGLRWDEENAIALCHGCHAYFTGYPLYFAMWIRERIGKQKYELLMHRSRKPTKWTKFDLEQIRLALKEKLAALKSPKPNKVREEIHVERGEILG